MLPVLVVEFVAVAAAVVVEIGDVVVAESRNLVGQWAPNDFVLEFEAEAGVENNRRSDQHVAELVWLLVQTASTRPLQLSNKNIQALQFMVITTRGRNKHDKNHIIYNIIYIGVRKLIFTHLHSHQVQSQLPEVYGQWQWRGEGNAVVGEKFGDMDWKKKEKKKKWNH